MPERHQLNRAGVWLTLTVVVAAVGFHATRVLAAGYGADNDTWLILGVWDHMQASGRYVPSRNPGYPVPEAVIGLMSHMGGPVLSGVMSVVLGGVAAICIFDVIQRRVEQRVTALLLTATLVATPSFVIASTTSIDYIYALACFTATWASIERRLPDAAVVVLAGLAVASRLTYLPLVIILILLTPAPDFSRARRTWCAIGGVVVSAMAYLPVVYSAKGSLSFLRADRPDGQGVLGHVGRMVVKATDLYGLVASLLLLALWIFILARRPGARSEATVDRATAGMLIVSIGTWVLMPVEPSYLLPTAVCATVALSTLAAPRLLRGVAVILPVLVVIFGFVELRVLGITYVSEYGRGGCEATEAASASFDVSLGQGPLLSYPTEEAVVRACNEQLRRQKAESG